MGHEGVNCATDRDTGSVKPGCCELCACVCGCVCFTDKQPLLTCIKAPSLFMVE